MKSTSKRTILALLLLCGVVLYATIGCTPRRAKSYDDSDEEIEYSGPVQDSVALLKSMEFSPRATQIYGWIAGYLSEDEKNLSITSEEYEIHTKAIQRIYGNMVNKKAEEVLASGASCARQHSLLKQLKEEIEPLIKSKYMHKEVKKQLQNSNNLIDSHNTIIQFGYSVQSQKSAYSLSDTYDMDYADKILSQAKAYQYPYDCPSVSDALKMVPTRLDKRHQSFLQSLVENYCQQDEYDYSNKSKVARQIDAYYYSGKGAFNKYGTGTSSARYFVDKLYEKMKKFEEQKEKEQKEKEQKEKEQKNEKDE